MRSRLKCGSVMFILLAAFFTLALPGPVASANNSACSDEEPLSGSPKVTFTTQDSYVYVSGVIFVGADANGGPQNYDPNSGSAGTTYYLNDVTVCAEVGDHQAGAAPSIPTSLVGPTGAEAGSVGSAGPGQSGASLDNTCVYVAGVPFPTGCGSNLAGVGAALDDVTPQVVTSPGICLVSLGGTCYVDIPSTAKLRFGQGSGDTLTVTVLDTDVPINIPPGTCVGLGCP